MRIVLTIAALIGTTAIGNSAMATESEPAEQPRRVDSQWQVVTLTTDKTAQSVKQAAIEARGVGQLTIGKPEPLVATRDAQGKLQIRHGSRNDWQPRRQNSDQVTP